MSKIINNIVFFKTLTLILVCLISVNGVCWPEMEADNENLAPQLLFDHPTDESLIKMAIVTSLSESNWLERGTSSPQETEMDDQKVILGTDNIEIQEDLPGKLITCQIQDRMYCAYIDTAQTRQAGVRVESEPGFDIHVYKQEEMKAYLDHEIEKDGFLATIETLLDKDIAGKKGRVALGLTTTPIRNVIRFIEAIENAGEAEPGTALLSGQVKEFAKGGNVFKVIGCEDVSSEKIDHASNRSIHVKDRENQDELETAIVHEIFAKLGIPKTINDSEKIIELVKKEYSLFKNNSDAFCPKKIIDMVSILSGWKINLVKRSFVDMGTQRDRDYALGERPEAVPEILSRPILETDLTGPVLSWMELKDVDAEPKGVRVKWEKRQDAEWKDVDEKSVEKKTFSITWEDLRDVEDAWEDADVEEQSQIQKILKGHEARITQKSVNSDENGNLIVVTGGYEETLRIWKLPKKGKIKTLKLQVHEGNIQSINLDIDKEGILTIISGSSDKKVRVWKIPKKGKIKTLKLPGHEDTVVATDIAKDDAENLTILSGSYDKTVRVWKVSKKGQIESLKLQTDGNSVCTAKLHKDAQGNLTIISGGIGKILRVWKVPENFHENREEKITTLELQGDENLDRVSETNLQIDNNGNIVIVSVSLDHGSVRVWKLPEKKAVETLKLRGHKKGIYSINVYTNKQGNLTIISGGVDKTVRRWEIPDRGKINVTTLQGHEEGIFTTDFNEDTQGNLTIVSGAKRISDRLRRDGKEDCTLRVWAIPKAGRKKVLEIQGHKENVCRVKLDTDAQGDLTIISGSDDRTVRLWKVPTLEEMIGLSLEQRVGDATLIAKHASLIEYVKNKCENPNYHMLAVYVLPHLINADLEEGKGKKLLTTLDAIMDEGDIPEFILSGRLVADMIANHETLKERIWGYKHLQEEILYGRKDIDPENEMELALGYTLTRGAYKSGLDLQPLDYETYKRRIVFSKDLPAQPQELTVTEPFVISELEYKEAPIDTGVIKKYQEKLKEHLAKDGYNWREHIKEILEDKTNGLKPYLKKVFEPLLEEFLKEKSYSSFDDVFRTDELTLEFMKLMAGKIAQILHREVNKPHMEQTLEKLIIAIIAKKRITASESRLIMGHNDSSTLEEQHKVMSLLSSIYTDTYPDVMKECITLISPASKIIQPEKGDKQKGMCQNRKAVKAIKQELAKVKIEHIKPVKVRLVPVKQKIDQNYPGIHDCVGSNEEAIYEKDFYLYRILIEGSNRIDGYVYIGERQVKGEKLWVIGGIHPPPDIDIDYDALLKGILEKIEEQAEKRNVKKLLISTDSEYHSYRTGMNKAIERANFEKIELEEEISFPQDGYPRDRSNKFLLAREVRQKKQRNKKENQDAVGLLKEKAQAIHMKNLEIPPRLGRRKILCYIIADSVIPQEQRDMVQRLEQEMRKVKYNEKIVRLKVKDSINDDDFIQALKERMKNIREQYSKIGYEVEFDIAVPNADIVAKIQFPEQGVGINALAFERQDGEFVQVEGIITALRAVRTGKIEIVRAAYKLITGQDLLPEQMEIEDVRIFARQITFTLPAATSIACDIIDLNNELKKLILSAA